MHGAIGWQGIIPSRAAKMGSIAVDKGIAKVGSPSEFYEQLEPEQIAEHILATSQRDIRELVDRTMQRERPELWNDLPPRIKEAVLERVESQLPEIVHEVTDQIGENIDQLLDIKLMVIRHIEERPEIANRIFLEVGERELKFIIKFGFFFGFVLGIPTVFLVHAVPALVGAADRRDGGRLGHQLAGDLDDLRARRAAEDRPVHDPRPVPAPPGPRPPTSTPTSSPTTSSRSSTSATSCSTARARTARAT